MVRRTTVVSRGPELRLTPNLVYSGVELQPVLESMSRGSEYADETYNRIHEVGYNLNGNANNKGSWSFHQLNPKCDVRVHYNSYVQADVTGLSSAVMITPYQRNTGGTTYTIRPEGQTFAQNNASSFSATGGVVVFHSVYAWDVAKPVGQEMVLVTAETPLGLVALKGTVWVSLSALAATTPNALFFRETAVSHELYHVASTITHQSNGPLEHLAQVLSSPVSPPAFVWNGSLASPEIDDIFAVLGPPVWPDSRLIAPVAVTEGGFARSQCGSLRANPDGFLY
jgi:hypothetical protein